MLEWTDFRPGPGTRPAQVAGAVASLVPDLRRTETPGGGLGVGPLEQVLAPTVASRGWTRPPRPAVGADRLHHLDAGARAVVSLHAGRALVNNDALLAVVAAAAADGVDWVVLVVPERYKGSTVATKVHAQVEALASTGLLAPHLHGVAVVGY